MTPFLSDPVEQFGLPRVMQNLVFHAMFVAGLPSQREEIDCMIQVSAGGPKDCDPFFAAFVGALPSRAPEIDCKLQSNSS